MSAVGGSGELDGGRHAGSLRYALAGIEAGVLGALLMIGCLAIGSLWNGRSIWTTPNLFATTFFGAGAYRNHFMRTSWAGLGLIIAMYGSLGALWGWIWREHRVRWLPLYGAVAGLGVYYLLFGLLWRHLNPLIAAYAPERQLQIGHVLWGMALARSPLYARRIAQATSPIRSTTREPQEAEPQEIRSGEVIR